MFKDWILSNYSAFGTRSVKPWNLAHIFTLLICIFTVILLTIIFRNKTEKERRNVIKIYAYFLIAFEVVRRIVNLIKMSAFTLDGFAYIMLPRPWCAISCWCFIVGAFLNKKTLYNITSMFGIICTLIFFAYPSVGFNEKFWVFEDLYSVGTHALLLTGAILLITLRFTEFKYKEIWKEAIFYGCSLVYVAFLIFTKIEGDPMYFMPESEAMEVLGLNYGVYLPIYIIFIFIYFNLFYLISERHKIFDYIHFHFVDRKNNSYNEKNNKNN
ncbi:MAG: YwaF family protein [Clostridia bacterium]|nr:YwaF family protein [Clostridia bacterium]